MNRTYRQPFGTTPILWPRPFWVLVLAWSCLLAPAFAQHLITFKSGATHECQIVGFENGIFTVILPDGTRAQTRQDNIVRIQFNAVPEKPSLPAEFQRVATPAAAPSQPPVPTPAPTPPPPPAAASASQQPARDVELTLASHWQHRLGRGTIAQRDASRLLSKIGTPQIDLAWKDLTLWRDIQYLMPLEEAKKKLGLGLSAKKSITCAVFPPSSLFAHEFSGHFDDGMTRLILITDMAEQVVGVQMQDNSSRSERWFPYSAAYATEWSLYNFIRDGRKANPTWEIGFYVCRGSQRVMGYPPGSAAMGTLGSTGVSEGIIRIDSELFSIRRNRYNLIEDSKSRERVRLYLPQPIVDLMLYIIQQSR